MFAARGAFSAGLGATLAGVSATIAAIGLVSSAAKQARDTVNSADRLGLSVGQTRDLR